MPKPRDPQTNDLFDNAIVTAAPGSLQNLKSRVAHAISAVIRNSGMDRYEIAARMSALLGEDVSKAMLDAYSAESREDQNIPAYRLFAFIMVTEAFGAFDDLVRPFGWRVLVGEQTKLAQLTHLEIHRGELDKRIRALRGQIKDGAR